MSSPETPRSLLAAVTTTASPATSVLGNGARARPRPRARVEGIYVVADSEPPPHEAAAAVGVPLRIVTGPVGAPCEAGCAEETAAMVIGSRSRPTSPHALGSTALAVVAFGDETDCRRSARRPDRARIKRVLVPLEGVSESPGPVSPIGIRGRV